jgi:hypothetical protein
MKAKFSIQKDGKVLVTRNFDITDVASFQTASTEIWRLARNAQPAKNPKEGEFLSGLDDLWGASMILDKAD